MRSDVLGSPHHTTQLFQKDCSSLIIQAFEPSAVVSVTNSLYPVTAIVKAESLGVYIDFYFPNLARVFFFQPRTVQGKGIFHDMY